MFGWCRTALDAAERSSDLFSSSRSSCRASCRGLPSPPARRSRAPQPDRPTTSPRARSRAPSQQRDRQVGAELVLSRLGDGRRRVQLAPHAALRAREQRHRQRGDGGKPDPDPAHLRMTATRSVADRLDDDEERRVRRTCPRAAAGLGARLRAATRRYSQTITRPAASSISESSRKPDQRRTRRDHARDDRDSELDHMPGDPAPGEQRAPAARARTAPAAASRAADAAARSSSRHEHRPTTTPEERSARARSASTSPSSRRGDSRQARPHGAPARDAKRGSRRARRSRRDRKHTARRRRSARALASAASDRQAPETPRSARLPAPPAAPLPEPLGRRQIETEQIATIIGHTEHPNGRSIVLCLVDLSSVRGRLWVGLRRQL